MYTSVLKPVILQRQLQTTSFLNAEVNWLHNFNVYFKTKKII